MSPFEQLKQELEQFFSLNPDISAGRKTALYNLARGVSPKHFPLFTQITERLIKAYLDSPPKQMQRFILGEFFDLINKSARRLTQGNSGSPRAEQEKAESGPPPSTTALVDRQKVGSLDWCRIVTSAKIPKSTFLAVEACRNRNELVSSVVEHILVILQLIDFDLAIEWQLDYLERNRGNLDPDIIRDLLNAWTAADQLPESVFEWLLLWSADEALGRQWPGVRKRADRLLAVYALDEWQRTQPEKVRSLNHLRLLTRNGRFDKDKLLNWLKARLVEIGQSGLFFVQLSEQQRKNSGKEPAWRQAAMIREIKSMEHLFTPVLLLIDLILAVPDGASQLALALFGLTGRGREEWQADLLQKAEKTVRHAFLLNLKQGIPPMDIIEDLSFGDPAVVRRMRSELDWASQNFDSIVQREKVTKELAVYYASFRESQLISEEISRRYRNLMRFTHEDNLKRVLTEGQYAEIDEAHTLRELAAMAGEARRFLSRRRALERNLEEVVAAEMDISKKIRRRRLHRIRRILLGNDPRAGAE